MDGGMLRRQKWQKRLAVAAVQQQQQVGLLLLIDEDGIENPCPLCLYTEDDADFGGNSAGMCFACAGSLTAVLATGWGDRLAARSPNCPTCRAPFSVEDFKRCWKCTTGRQDSTLQLRSATSATCTAMEEVSSKTTSRQPRGTERRPRQGVQWRRQPRSHVPQWKRCRARPR